MSEKAGTKGKLVIVERKLIRNRGHQHTQIGALRKWLPDHDLHLVTGEGYDGFLGNAVAKLPKHSKELSTLHWRIRNGSLRQKADALTRALLSGQIFSLPHSPYGRELLAACDTLRLERTDIVIVPSADLDLLETACHLAAVKKEATPRLILRFLDPELGDHKDTRREERLKLLAKTLSSQSQLELFCETDEMATYLKGRYGLDVQGGFYLPVSFDPTDLAPLPEKKLSTAFRVGLFGAPRPGKGYQRITSIYSCLEKLARKTPPEKPIEILLQGADTDFGDSGIYGFARQHQANEARLRLQLLPDRMSPEVFSEHFLSVDAILLPYDTSVYGLQGSGIIQDAVAIQKVIVHSKGIAMQSFLSHGNAVAAESDEDFARTLLALSAQKEINTTSLEEACLHYQSIIKSNKMNLFS